MDQSAEIHQAKMSKMMQPPEGQVGNDEVQANIEAVMQEFGVDETIAITALAAEAEGLPKEDIIAKLQELQGGQQWVGTIQSLIPGLPVPALAVPKNSKELKILNRKTKPNAKS